MLEVKVTEESLQKLMDVSGRWLAEMLQKEIVDSAKEKKIRFTGKLIHEIVVGKKGRKWGVFIRVPYALLLEEGGKPEHVDIDKLKRWVAVKKGESGKRAERAAWAIKRTIEKKGIKPKRFIATAMDEFREKVMRIGR